MIEADFPTLSFSTTTQMLVVRRLFANEEDISHVFQLMQNNLKYSQNITGRPASLDDARSVFAELPPHKNFSDKFVLGAFCDDALLGCADVVRGYPNDQTGYVGLMMISEAQQGKGLGRGFYSCVEHLLNHWRMSTARLSVVQCNDHVLPFWYAMGFRETGERKPYVNESVCSEHILLEKNLRNSSL